MEKIKPTYVKALICDGTKREPIPAVVLELDLGKEAILNVNLESRLEKEVETEIEQRIWEGKLIELRVLEGSKGVVLYTGIVSYILKQRIHVRQLKARGNFQRRKDVKARVRAQSVLHCLSLDCSDEIPIVLRDISAGGIGFYVNKEYEELLVLNEEYKINFDEGDALISLCFFLRWFTEMQDGRISCGGQFYDLRRMHERIIRKFVFDKECEERKAIKEELERQKELQELLNEMDKEEMEENAQTEEVKV